ncbi:hypothetical protein GUITHDRAFT_118941 [Guillardia theta CCMP2712]|uniref:Uncharacterized protein n=1 Tax=Guillardia theta (strain CCMP2712) TaxID=905079 RepID=L1IF98_GUITC|nr:hypothetical protein GUITHDRAFT_118941 [Guillardia theta CCMP2712]EKX34898.1 hypothetical protein GUITHDRAFT_118941 [Guillardia theta CCMP2712]|eukprot:XP_005821878.1 hypothetical protein GUITHDRAFT_118941 [Guillardia theta CCMP2712]
MIGFPSGPAKAQRKNATLVEMQKAMKELSLQDSAAAQEEEQEEKKKQPSKVSINDVELVVKRLAVRMFLYTIYSKILCADMTPDKLGVHHEVLMDTIGRDEFKNLTTEQRTQANDLQDQLETMFDAEDKCFPFFPVPFVKIIMKKLTDECVYIKEEDIQSAFLNESLAFSEDLLRSKENIISRCTVEHPVIPDATPFQIASMKKFKLIQFPSDYKPRDHYFIVPVKDRGNLKIKICNKPFLAKSMESINSVVQNIVSIRNLKDNVERYKKLSELYTKVAGHFFNTYALEEEDVHVTRRIVKYKYAQNNDGRMICELVVPYNNDYVVMISRHVATGPCVNFTHNFNIYEDGPVPTDGIFYIMDNIVS